MASSALRRPTLSLNVLPLLSSSQGREVIAYGRQGWALPLSRNTKGSGLGESLLSHFFVEGFSSICADNNDDEVDVVKDGVDVLRDDVDVFK